MAGATPAPRTAVITRDPDTGYLNVGTYRMMLQGKNEAGLYLHREKTRACTSPVPGRWASPLKSPPLGVSTHCSWSWARRHFPRTFPNTNFSVASKASRSLWSKGRPPTCFCPPMRNLSIEGIIKPNSVKSEGPFGEFPGYYGRPEAGCPLVEITAVHYRNNPILTNALMADYPSQ